jgi:hypothetical protein
MNASSVPALLAALTSSHNEIAALSEEIARLQQHRPPPLGEAPAPKRAKRAKPDVEKKEKRTPTAYNLFVRGRKGVAVEVAQGEKPMHVIARLWKAMSEEQRKPFEDAAEAAKAQRAMAKSAVGQQEEEEDTESDESGEEE